MFTVSDKVRLHLYKMLAHFETNHDCTARLLIENNAVTIKTDSARDEDFSFAYKTRTVLVVDENVVRRLGNKTLDIQTTSGGIRFSLH